MDNDQEHITLGFFGAVAVGKTSINVQYIKHVFLQEHDPTLEDFFETTKKFGKTDKVTHLTIYDTAGQEQYSTLLPQHMRESEGFMLVFSVTDKSSFSKISSVYNKVLDIKEKDKVPMVLVGNKIDLREKRVVSTEEGKKLADELRIPYIETSAKERINIDEAFELLVNEVRMSREAEKKKEEKTPPRKSRPKSERAKSLKKDDSKSNKCIVQ